MFEWLRKKISAPAVVYRPWERCMDAPWPYASRLCEQDGLIVGMTYGSDEGHWAAVNFGPIGKYATQAEAQAAVSKRLGIAG